jgi:hypothetical protein
MITMDPQDPRDSFRMRVRSRFGLRTLSNIHSNQIYIMCDEDYQIHSFIPYYRAALGGGSWRCRVHVFGVGFYYSACS